MKSSIIEPLESRIAPAVISILAPADQPKNEGSGANGTTDFTFTVTLDAASLTDVTVVATATDGTALLADNDFLAKSETLTIPAGELQHTFTVQVKQDTKREGDETFSVVLSDPSAGDSLSLTESSALATITNDDAVPQLSIGNVSRLENADSGTTPATTAFTFHITLDHASDQPITVLANTLAGTATEGDDYTAIVNQMVTFAAGEIDKTVTVTVANDGSHEANETFKVVLSDPANATINGSEGTGTIQNDDPKISIGDLTLMENADVATTPGTTLYTFHVTLDQASTEQVTVRANTVAGTAAAGTDYTSIVNQLITFAPGETDKTVVVSVVNDTRHEADETFKVVLSNPTGGLLGTAEATGTIQNDDPIPVATIGNVTKLENADAGSTANSTAFTFTITLDRASSDTVTVTANTVDVTATAGAGLDYTALANQVVTFAPGETSKTVTVTVNNDGIHEAAETFKVALSAPTNATLGAAFEGTGTINNDDALVKVTAQRTLEGANGSKFLTFTVERNSDNNAAIPFHFSTKTESGDAATPGAEGASGADYLAVNGDFTISEDAQSTTINVQIFGDTTAEASETFTVEAAPTAEPSVTAKTKGTISNDDNFLSISDATIAEGNTGQVTATFTLAVTPSPVGTVKVTVKTVDGTATSAGGAPDFVAKTEVITFAAGESFKTFTVVINGDRVFESASEMFNVVFTQDDVEGALVVDGSATGTITDSADTPATVSISGGSVAEGDVGGTNKLVYTITLSEAAGDDVVVNLAPVANGTTATAGDDFGTIPTSVTVPAGQKTVTVEIPITGDTADEADETLVLGIVSAIVQNDASTELQVTTGSAIGKILNDDLTLSLPTTFTIPTEGGVGANTPFLLPYTLSASPTGHDVTFTFSVTGLTATAGDFAQPTLFTVTIPAGASVADLKFAAFNVLGDALDEADETVKVTLVSVTGAKLGNAESTVTITDDDAQPIVTVDNVSVTEGQSAAFKVSLDAVSGQDVIVTYVVNAGTATAGTDYTPPATLSVTIPAGSLSANIAVPVINDVQGEDAETFSVVLQTADHATVGGANTGTATIAASDPVSFSILDAKVVEGNGIDTDGKPTGDPDDVDQKFLEFTINKSGATDQTTSVTYSTQNGTANSATDYTAVSGVTVTFAPGETSKTIRIAITGDTAAETDETLFVNLSSPTNGTIGDGSATGTVQNDETTYKIVPVGSFSVTEENGAAQRVVQFKILRTGDLSIAGTVSYSTLDDDTMDAIKAIAGTDYTAKTGTVSFGAGQAESATISINIAKDELPESNETFKLKLSSPVNGVISDVANEGEAVITIEDNDTANLPRVRVADVKIVEGNATGSDLVFKIKLVDANGAAKAAGGVVTVTFNLADLTATAGSDYTVPTETTVTFAAGETEKEVHVALTGDTTDEADETFTLNITDAKLEIASAPNPTVFDLTHDDSATGTILNDDLTVSVSSAASLPEGNANNDRTFTISIPQASTHDVTVHIKTKDGTAISTANNPLADYTAYEDTVTIPAGQTSADFTVQIKGDSYFEPSEAFTLEFSDSTGAIVSATSYTATIVNDDAAPTLSIGDASIVEGDNGSLNLVFTVFLAGATQQPITVNYVTTDGTAKSSGPQIDFTSVSGVLTFQPSAQNSQSATFSVPILGDTWKEISETFTATLSGAKLGDSTSGVTVTDATATGTIIDNGDTTLGLIIRDAKVVERAANGGAKLSFVIDLTAPAEGSAVTFLASTRAGTATSADFTMLASQLKTIAVGASTLTIDVAVTGDSTFEATEYMFLDLKEISANATTIQGTGDSVFARGTIYNDDIHVISPREFEYIDPNGDLVNVRFSKGSITVPITSNSSADLTFVPMGDVGGRYLKLINLADDGNEFLGANIIITARPQVLASGEFLGDGRANVGSIESAIPSSDLFQFQAGVNLGKVVVPGDLGRIISGNIRAIAGLGELVVGSLGGLPDDSSATARNSVVLGPVGRVTVNGDVLGSLSVIGDAFAQPVPNGVSGIGRIGTLVVKGALKGTTEGTGQISFTGGIGSATIGSIVGGTGKLSGALLPVDGRFNTTIGRLTVLGDVTGGDGSNTGYVNATHIGNVTLGKIPVRTTDSGIEGNLIGGNGSQSGSIVSGTTIGVTVINGDIRGGAGETSGQLFAATILGATRILGDLVGGMKDDSDSARTADSAGSIVAGVVRGALTVEGSVIGGDGDNTGLIFLRGYTSGFNQIAGSASSITLGKAGVIGSGDLTGGTAQAAGFVQVNGNLPRLTIYGDVEGGNFSTTGGIVVTGNLGAAQIKGSLLGGDTGTDPDTDEDVSVFQSGYIDAGNIASLVIGGRIAAGANLGGTDITLGRSGSIAAAGSITSVQVTGLGTDSLLGTAATPVLITAGNSIGKATFGQDVTFAEILAGFAGAAEETPRGVLINAAANIGTVTVNGIFTSSSIAAGVDAGGDGRFGTVDDQALTEGELPPANLNLVSRIASVILRQVGDGDSNPDAAFGIVAERVDSVKVGGIPVVLLAGPHNDRIDLNGTGVLVGGAATKLKVVEI